MLLIIFLSIAVLFIGCSSNETELTSEEQQKVDNLMLKIDAYSKENNYMKMIEVYKEVYIITQSKEHESLIAELEQKVMDNDRVIVRKIISEVESELDSPESLQINNIIIARGGTWPEFCAVYMDYSAMNKLGGYSRDYASASFENEEFVEFKEQSKDAFASLEEGIGDELYYFDIEELDN